MKKLFAREVLLFQDKILNWFAKNKRDLPWREVPYDTSLKQRDPYKILVSEVMLQQTQATRVVPKYEAWLTKFPTVQSLAKANTRDVLALWSGLGYNRRALHLQNAARILVESGIKNQELRIKKADTYSYWPRTIDGLKKLPGIGEYTARAILCFAFDEQVAVVDTNVRKVILTQFMEQSASSTKQSEKELQKIADELLPRGKAYVWNQALMDYSAAVLRKEKIEIPKQSKFLGSNRYYRGKVLKILLERQSISFDRLGESLKKDFSANDHGWLEGLLKNLSHEGFILIDKASITIASGNV